MQNYNASVLNAIRLQQAKLQAAVNILEMGDDQFTNTFMTSSTLGKGGTTRKQTKRTATPKKGTKRSNGRANVVKAKDPKRSAAAKRRWARVKAMQSAQPVAADTGVGTLIPALTTQEPKAA